MLKLKAAIYKYFGVYLAHKEENAYLKSRGFWNHFDRAIENPKNDISSRNLQGIYLGLWQAHNGLHRQMSRLTFKKGLWKPVAWFHTLWLTLKSDAKDILKCISGK